MNYLKGFLVDKKLSTAPKLFSIALFVKINSFGAVLDVWLSVAIFAKCHRYE